MGSDGKRIRRKVTGRTKTEVRDKLKALHSELDAGLQPSAGCTVQAPRAPAALVSTASIMRST